MNLFYFLVSNDVGLGVVNRLIDRYKSEQSFISYALTDDYKKIKGTTPHLYSYEELKQADYSNYKYSGECPPLEESLLKSMAECESIVIKMMERLNPRPEPPPDYEERVRRYHRHLRYWNYVLDVGKIEIAAFSDAPHGTYDYIVYCLCKKKGIATAFPYFGTILGYLYFSEDLNFHCPELPAVYQKYAQELKETPIKEIKLLPDFQKKFETLSDRTLSSVDKAPYYVRFHYASFPQKIKSWASKVVQHIKMGVPHILVTAQRLSIERRRNQELYDTYDSLAVAPDCSKSYVYYPLHYQPECSTCPLGGVFVHQLLVAEMLSAHLPDGVWLYVKEHPQQRSFLRNTQLYRDLAALHNVKLIHRSADSFQLMEHCTAVASITGTAGFEAQFLEKPFLMFGAYINMHAPGTFNIRSNEDCQKALKFVFRNGAKHTLKDMKIYLKALSEVMQCCSNDTKNWPTTVGNEEGSSRIESGIARVLDRQLNKLHPQQ